MTDQRLPVTGLSQLIDGVVIKLGSALGLIWLMLIGVIVVNVISRYLFSEGFIELEELQWHLYATGFLLGLSYALVQDAHVRVDVFRSRWSDQTQAWVEIYGLLLLLLPFVLYAYETSEVSQAPGGLPFRWVIKTMLPVGFVLLLLATLSRLSRVLCLLFGWPKPGTAP